MASIGRQFLCKNPSMRPIVLLLCVLIAFPPALSADDGAASIAAGGIIVMKRETRIVMAKEVLTISPTRVVVDYDFRNDTDQDVSTEVAFPIPSYKLEIDGAAPALQGFDDFKLWIDGHPAEFDIETRAFVGKRDVTEMLLRQHIDIGSFGHFKWNNVNGPGFGPNFLDLKKLSKAQMMELVQSKAVSNDEDHEPLWRVQKKYHWSQIFPAHATVRIRHEYSPVVGNTNSVSYGLTQSKEDPESAKELATACLSQKLRKTLLDDLADGENSIPFSYVDFILTTANTWKTPIEDFTLIIEKNHPKGAKRSYTSLCWDGPVTRIDADHFSVRAVNLVPTKELRVGYIDVFSKR